MTTPEPPELPFTKTLNYLRKAYGYEPCMFAGIMCTGDVGFCKKEQDHGGIHTYALAMVQVIGD